MSQAEVATRRSQRARRRPRRGTSALGVLGELLITAGVIVALFVVWQVFWTDVTGGRAANAHIASFEEVLPESPEQPGTPQTGEPPAEPTPAAGETFATMFVPRWGPGWEFPIAEGIGRAEVLDAGFVGHYPETQLPGEVGNFALAGHRQSHAKPFFGVDSLETGDSVIVQTAQAWYVYTVTESYVVLPSQTEVLAPSPGEPGVEATERSITLTTCHPLWSTRERWIIHGVLDHWVDRSEGRPAEIIELLEEG
ncbi:class E sortase [Pseudactinotalea sp.]|uniref:class E sortase n=1 Tax=Pseudactinotalea sp. TaxID=1926260 RepID=UPI003B3AC643